MVSRGLPLIVVDDIQSDTLAYISFSQYEKKHIQVVMSENNHYDVKNRVFSQNVLRDSDHFYAQFSFDNHKKYNRCENRTCNIKRYVKA